MRPLIVIAIFTALASIQSHTSMGQQTTPLSDLRSREYDIKPFGPSTLILQEGMKIGDSSRSSKSSNSAGSQTRPSGLSKTLLIYSSINSPRFFEPPKDVSVNYKLLRADVHFFNNGKFTFRLGGKQKLMHLECGLSDYGPRGSNQLRVIGDGRQVLSREYNIGHDAAVSDVAIQGVQALTFILSGTGDFYCKDNFVY
jgi:hypothetical protein